MRGRGPKLLERTEIPVSAWMSRPGTSAAACSSGCRSPRRSSNNPAILFLDEVTTGLDLSVQARVLDLIRSLQQEFHVSMMVVSHDLGVIRSLTSRTMVMRHGRVVESGLTDQILEDPQHPYTQLLVSSHYR